MLLEGAHSTSFKNNQVCWRLWKAVASDHQSLSKAFDVGESDDG